MSDNESVSYRPSPLGLTSRIFHVRHLALSTNILLNFLSKQYIPSCWIKLIILPQAAFFKILSLQEKGGDTMNSE